ncbi:MAG: nucleoside hydrolase [Alphaproteobacteria bacterium]|nr:nucleoside hydrolase [Alphaproteobacteria bacterium]MBU1551512.1 nucleoside hydrolase [Alphaproteobacteria bacterium]MBU2337247.1 nucleoside hydrolase [Alphaproteobacteria bacterium]MBU2387990.1 nucleoside hydrolase [Alphaproteobacteria bacterium]
MKTHKVIIDADPGVDDAAAILMALGSPEIEVLGLSVVAGNVALEHTLANACKLVSLCGRRDVPVHAGAGGPLVREQVFGKYAAIGAFDDTLVRAGDIVPAAENAVQFIARKARAAAAAGDPINICAIGPMTNVALALIQHPDVASGIRQIVCMGGAFTALGHRTPWAEFNIYADPHAAEIVLQSGIPVVLMPLDMTFQALFTADHFERFRAGGEAGAALYNLFSTFDRSDEARFGRPGGPIHDATTIAWLIRPDLFTSREAFVGVQITGVTKGYTYADFYRKLDRPANATVVTHVNETGFIELLIERIARHGLASSDRHIAGGTHP